MRNENQQRFYLEASFPAKFFPWLVLMRGIAKYRKVRSLLDFRKGILTVYYHKDDVLQDSQKMTDRILKSQKYLNDFLNFCTNFAEKILKEAETFKNVDPSRKSNRELWRLTKKIIDIIDLQGKTVIKARKRPLEIVQEYLKHRGLKIVEIPFILGKMIVFSRRNPFLNEEKEFLKKILTSPKKDYSVIFKEHLDKWEWLYTNILSSSPLQVSDLRKRCKNPKARLEEINKKIKEETRVKNRLIRKYIIDEKMFSLLRILEFEGFYRLYRRCFLSKLLFYSQPLFCEIAKRIGVNKNEIYLLTPEEIKKFLLKGKQITPKLRSVISKRKRHCLIFVKGKENKFYYSEKLIAKLINKFCEKLVVSSEMNIISGQIGNIGKAKGIVYIIQSMNDFYKIKKKNSILVTTETTPEFIPILKKVKAIITDRGGVTCHAAIVSRELKIPCIVGTRIATEVLKDGDLVEVDANKGVVRILNK